jgi:hypothetical protein
VIKFRLLALFYRFLQVTYLLALPNVDQERLIGLVENPTEELEELVI